MKKVILNTLIFLVILKAGAQDLKRLDYKFTESGYCDVTSIKDSNKGEGNRGRIIWLDENYAKNVFYDIIKGVLPKDKLEKVNLGSFFRLYIKSNGDILNCSFSIDSNDLKILSEDDLFNLYNRFMKLKVDASKFRLETETYPADYTIFNYCEIFGSLLPVEYRGRWLKKH
jgi:hypothetical protein